jgi:Lar family restriction alleviation protein
VTELLPCPFCGGTDVIVGHKHYDYEVWCRGCNASSAMHANAQNSIAAWNRRAVPQDGSAVEVADVNVVNALRYYIEHEADFTPRDRIAIAHRAIAALRACGVEP